MNLLIILGIIFIIALVSLLYTRHSVKKRALEKAYWLSIRQAEVAHFKLVYGKYISAHA